MPSLTVYNTDNNVVLDDTADDLLALSQLLDSYLEQNGLAESLVDLKFAPVYMTGNLKRDDDIVGRYELNT